ncbi:MAG: DUF1015 domain-containing protein [Deltaproteobacteria bacterium]|nr:MAG: DUF1015 domain-containing protein [Deltaproteobacteria bacterium]
MSDVRPFRGLRPRDDLAAEVIAPPYDVLSEAEARDIAARHPRSFLHVTRSEVDLPAGTDPHSPEAYQRARDNLDLWERRGWLQRDEEPCFYLYSLTWRGRTQVGLMAACSVAEYDDGRIKRHELTRPDKEQDRADHIATLSAQTGLVFLAWRDRYPAVSAAMAAAAARPPAWRCTTEDGVEHALTVVSDPETVARLRAAFAEVPALYVADGHHRSAAASRIRAARGGRDGSDYFLAGIFPDSELQVLAYNRLVADLHGHDAAGLRAAIAADFELTDGVDPVPPGRGHWTMYLDGRWVGLRARPGVVPDDPVGSLDVSVLQDRILGPLLGIENPRTDPRIRFVGGIRGHEALSAAVDAGDAAVAFHLHPTGMDQLFAVADAGQLMPPKSTWFEPKLRGGVVVRRLDAREQEAVEST